MTCVQRDDVEHDDLFVPHFVRWQVNPAGVVRIDRHRAALVIEQNLDHRGNAVPAPVLLCLGPAEDLAELLPQTVARLSEVPYRVGIEAHAAHLLPTDWRWERRRVWDWMWTVEAPAVVPGEDALVRLGAHQADEVDALLDVANPETHGRPADDGAQQWLGVRGADGSLLAAGGMFLLPTGAGHLRGITTLPQERGRGLGTALTAGLTRLALTEGEPMCSLGVYSDNAAAIGIYERLGFRHGHTFCSGTLLR